MRIATFPSKICISARLGRTLAGVPLLLALFAQTGCGQGSANKAGARASGPVPVVASIVQKKDTPIYLDGIGTVSAFNTVTVHTQIDGQLQKVAFKEGQDVNAGDLLAALDSRYLQAQLNVAKGKLAEDVAQLANAKNTFERNSALADKGLLDQLSTESYRAAYEQAEALVRADTAAVSSAEVQLGYTQITSPISGRTGLRQVDVGNIVHPGDTNGLVVVAQLRPISVVFTLPQPALEQIHQAMVGNATPTVIAVGRDGRTVLDQGQLAVVDNLIDTTTGTVRLKATFPNDNLALWPGQFVNIRLLVSTRSGGIVVPASVVQRGPQGAYAFVIGADDTVKQRVIQVAQMDGGLALIDSGLKPGEKVVVDGQYKLQDGSPVTATMEGAASPRPGQGSGDKSKRSQPKS